MTVGIENAHKKHGKQTRSHATTHIPHIALFALSTWQLRLSCVRIYSHLKCCCCFWKSTNLKQAKHRIWHVLIARRTICIYTHICTYFWSVEFPCTHALLIVWAQNYGASQLGECNELYLCVGYGKRRIIHSFILANVF